MSRMIDTGGTQTKSKHFKSKATRATIYFFRNWSRLKILAPAGLSSVAAAGATWASASANAAGAAAADAGSGVGGVNGFIGELL